MHARGRAGASHAARRRPSAAIVVVLLALASIAPMAPISAPTWAQARAPAAPTVEDRVTLLERELVNLEAKLSAGTTLGSGALSSAPTESALAARVDDLERNLSRLTADLQRLQQQADSALREATQARREAMEAQRTARDAANRIR
jgi:chromosome segregation ATPase